MGGVIWLTRVGTYFQVSKYTGISMSLIATICYYLLKHCWLWLGVFLLLLSCRNCDWPHDLPPYRVWFLLVQPSWHSGRHLLCPHVLFVFYALDLQCLHTECGYKMLLGELAGQHTTIFFMMRITSQPMRFSHWPHHELVMFVHARTHIVSRSMHNIMLAGN